MEDNKPNQPISNVPPDNGNVMDVQSQPQPQAPTPTVTQPVAPPAPTSSNVNEAQKSGLSPELIAQAEAETKKKADAANPEAKPATPGSHKKSPKLVVIVAVVVFLALAGTAVYAYMQSQKDKDQHPDDHADMSQQEMDTHQPATSKELEDTAKELDETINTTNEEQEIPGEGLSEDAVGL